MKNKLRKNSKMGKNKTARRVKIKQQRDRKN